MVAWTVLQEEMHLHLAQLLLCERSKNHSLRESSLPTMKPG